MILIKTNIGNAKMRIDSYEYELHITIVYQDDGSTNLCSIPAKTYLPDDWKKDPFPTTTLQPGEEVSGYIFVTGKPEDALKFEEVVFEYNDYEFTAQLPTEYEEIGETPPI